MFLLPLFFASKKKRDNKKDLKRNHTFILYFPHLFVSLASPKILPFGNKNKYVFILYFPHLFVSLQQIK